MDMAATSLIQPVSAAIDEKLGRCARCIRWSLALTALAWLAVLALDAAGMTSSVWAMGVPAIGFTALSLAHGIAYVVRGPAPTGCKSCAEKRKAHQRIARWRRLKWRLRHPFAQRKVQARQQGCKTCPGPRTLDEAMNEADELSPADQEIRGLIEATPEFQSIVAHLAETDPSDTWHYNLRNHFVYTLKPDAYGVGATALFVRRWEDDGFITAAIVIPDDDGGEPRVIDLRERPAVIVPSSSPASSSHPSRA